MDARDDFQRGSGPSGVFKKEINICVPPFLRIQTLKRGCFFLGMCLNVLRTQKYRKDSSGGMTEEVLIAWRKQVIEGAREILLINWWKQKELRLHPESEPMPNSQPLKHGP